jgi:hypothetical protein
MTTKRGSDADRSVRWWWSTHYMYGDTLDAAIDAARAAND